MPSFSIKRDTFDYIIPEKKFGLNVLLFNDEWTFAASSWLPQEVVWGHCERPAMPAGLITGPDWWRRAGRMPLGWDAVSLAPGGDEWLVVRSLCSQLPFENQKSCSFMPRGWAFRYVFLGGDFMWLLSQYFTQWFCSSVMMSIK